MVRFNVAQFDALTFYREVLYSFCHARMVELVDTLVSGTSAFTSMEVRVFFRAIKKLRPVRAGFFYNQDGRGRELPEAPPSEYEGKGAGRARQGPEAGEPWQPKGLP